MTIEPREVFFNFAYGSNMSTVRLRERVPSAQVVGRGVLHGYQLLWHKVSIDGSGKCDVVESEAQTASVHGVVYSIDRSERAALDRAEGLGKGYAEREIVVEVNGAPRIAMIYYATIKDPSLLPYSWYKAHVLAGAHEHALPPAYIAGLEEVQALQDPDARRNAVQMELVRKNSLVWRQEES